MNIIRKISIGPDYKNAMHFTVGQTALRIYVISEIVRIEGGDIDIYVKKPSEISEGKFDSFKWKTITNSIPSVIEHNIDFE